MSRIRKWLTCPLALASLALADDIRLAGYVVDHDDVGLQGAGVSLVRGGLSTTTDAHGDWHLAPTTGLQARPSAVGTSRWTASGLELNLTSPAQVTVEAYDLKGASQGRLANLQLGAGTRRLPLDLKRGGLVWLRVTVNGHSEVLLASAGAMGGSTSGGAIATHGVAARSGQPVVDTLNVTWKNVVVSQIELQSTVKPDLYVRLDTATTVGWNEAIHYENLLDTRDGQTYRTVNIGDQVWMAENLNYAVPNSRWSAVRYCTEIWGIFECGVHNDSLAKGERYGRLYTWPAAMGLADSCLNQRCMDPDSCLGGDCSQGPIHPQAGICPTGWHIPSILEWTKLIKTVQADPRVGRDSVGIAIRSKTDWLPFAQGQDLFGFRLLAGGEVTPEGDVDMIGFDGFYWTSSWMAGNTAIRIATAANMAYLDIDSDFKGYGYSVRCLKN